MLMTQYSYPVLRVPESGGQRCCEVWGDDKSLCHTLAFIQMISKVGQDWTVVRIVTISLIWCTLLTHGNFKGRHLSWKSCQVWTRSFLSVFLSGFKYIGCWRWYTRRHKYETQVRFLQTTPVTVNSETSGLLSSSHPVIELAVIRSLTTVLSLSLWSDQ